MPPAKLIVISAPSGCGKTTIAREFLRRHPEIDFSVSATTRARRPKEADGRDYFFLSVEEFRNRIDRGELVEWEQIYGDLYGTLKSEVDRALKGGRRMIFDLDVKGALAIKRKYPEDTILIFIKPPSLEVLKERLVRRRTESEAAIQKRLERVPMELAEEKNFDYTVVNDDISRAVGEVERITGLTDNSKSAT